MREALKTILCIALMAAFGHGLHWLMFDVKASFGAGLGVGSSMMAFFIWLAWKVDPEYFNDRRSEEEKEKPMVG